MSATVRRGNGTWAPWTERVGLAVLWAGVSVVIWAAYRWAPAAGGFPGESSRIVFFHVPLAFVSFLSFLVATGYAVAYLARGRLVHDESSAGAAGLGLLFCVLTTITGAIFSRRAWGAYWNWDPRQTSILVVLMIYGAYFALRSAVDRPEKRAALSSVYVILAFTTLPFLFFVLPRITLSLHPSDTLSPANPGMDAPTLRVFAASAAAHLALFAALLNTRIRVARLETAPTES